MTNAENLRALREWPGDPDCYLLHMREMVHESHRRWFWDDAERIKFGRQQQDGRWNCRGWQQLCVQLGIQLAGIPVLPVSQCRWCAVWVRPTLQHPSHLLPPLSFLSWHIAVQRSEKPLKRRILAAGMIMESWVSLHADFHSQQNICRDGKLELHQLSCVNDGYGMSHEG